MNFKNMDKLMTWINARLDQYGVQLRYSTPTDYLYEISAVRREREKEADGDGQRQGEKETYLCMTFPF